MSRIEDYVEAVTRRLRPDPELHMDIAHEVQAHLEDAAAEARARGLSDEEGVEAALKAFGDRDEIAERIWQAVWPGGVAMRMAKRQVWPSVRGRIARCSAKVSTRDGVALDRATPAHYRNDSAADSYKDWVSMQRIRLPRGEWWYDPNAQLGKAGGFGEVFEGTGEGHCSLAVKKLRLEARQTAHREMTIADDLADRTFAHVIPVLDAGQDADSGHYFVVMRRADKSLQDELDTGKVFGDMEAAETLLAIVHGLTEVSDIVHRDLKPGNILLHEGTWKVADFGIARFVEESTSARTVKGCLTHEYAAPEQWEFKHATGATDIYALGCIGYALLTGHPPFQGSKEDLRDHHLHGHPPKLAGHDPRLCSLLTMMLRKAKERRPNLGRVQTLFKEIIQHPRASFSSQGFEALAEAGATVADSESKEEAQRALERRKLESRKRLANEAIRILRGILDELFVRIQNVAAAAVRESELRIRIGQASLIVQLRGDDRGDDVVIEEDAFPQSGWDVVTGATIRVEQRQPDYKWGASLWYFREDAGDEYRWKEVGYMLNPLVGRPQRYEPSSQDEAHADEAAGPAMGMFQIAYGPTPIDDEDANKFYDRWAGRLAKASQRELCRPSQLPLSRDPT